MKTSAKVINILHALRSVIASLLLSTTSALCLADSWGTPDKLQHFGTSIVWGAGARVVCPDCSELKATALGTIPGLVKEIQDSLNANGSGWSNRDLIADIAGAYVGQKFMGLTIKLYRKRFQVQYQQSF
jgi:uncharacterized protein YfiM (DUF2279 family)